MSGNGFQPWYLSGSAGDGDVWICPHKAETGLLCSLFTTPALALWISDFRIIPVHPLSVVFKVTKAEHYSIKMCHIQLYILLWIIWSPFSFLSKTFIVRPFFEIWTRWKLKAVNRILHSYLISTLMKWIVNLILRICWRKQLLHIFYLSSYA